MRTEIARQRLTPQVQSPPPSTHPPPTTHPPPSSALTTNNDSERRMVVGEWLVVGGWMVVVIEPGGLISAEQFRSSSACVFSWRHILLCAR